MAHTFLLAVFVIAFVWVVLMCVDHFLEDYLL
jgi:hypothetical protein